MLSADTVFEKVKEISGCTDESLMTFCEKAAAEISCKKRPGVSASDIRLLLAAAAIAYCDYLLVQNLADGDVGSVRAGDITVTKSGQTMLRSAENMKKESLAEASDLLIDSQFLFGTV